MIHDFLPVLYDRCSHFGIKPRAIDRSPQCDQNVSVIKNTAKHSRIRTNFKLSRIIMKYNGVCCVPCIVFMNRENNDDERRREGKETIEKLVSTSTIVVVRARGQRMSGCRVAGVPHRLETVYIRIQFLTF